MTRIVLATCAEYRDLSASDRIYRDALARRGVAVDAGVWTDGIEPFLAADLVVIRATWDYHRQLDAYRAWLKALADASLPVANPVELILWNLEKAYLDQLAAAGIPVPAQRIVGCDLAEVRAAMTGAGWTRAVVKPLAGASGHGVQLVDAARLDESWPTLSQAVAPHRLVLQEFISEIRSEGQVSYIFFDGRLSHAVRLLPRRGEFRINSVYGPEVAVADPSPAEISEARRVLTSLPGRPLYARIDMVKRGHRQVLLEAEVNEPGLFFHHVAAGADHFAQATLKWIDRRSPA